MGIRGKLRRLRNAKKNKVAVKKIEKDLCFLAEVTDLSACLPHERRLVKDLLLLSKKFKKDNSLLLQPLHLYFSGLYHKGRISLDKTASNPSIELFTDAFLQNAKEMRKLFYDSALQKVIMMLMLANLSVHRVQHATQLFEKYRTIFSETYKARLYVRLFAASCGNLELKYVTDLFEQAEKTYFNTCNTLESKADFLYHIYVISKGTVMEIPGLERIAADFSNDSKGQISDGIAKLYREYCFNNEFLEQVGCWLESVSSVKMDVHSSENAEEIRVLYKGRINGEKEIRKPHKTLRMTEKELPYKNSLIRTKYLDKTYDLDKLTKEIREAIDFYRAASLEKRGLTEKIIASNTFFSLKLLLPQVKYWRDYQNNFLKVRRQGNNNDIVFVEVNEYSLVNGAVTFPFLLEARRRGIPCYSYSPRIHLDSCSPEDSFYDYYGWAAGGKDTRFCQDNDISESIIDIPNKKIMVRGLNVYQPIFEFVSRYQFTYEYKYETDAWARYRTVLLIRAYDSMFRYLEQVEKWAKENNKRIFFISNAPHIHNAAAFRIYCEEKGYKNGLEFICTSPGYDNYFLNATDPRSETTTAVNMTRHLEARSSFLGTKEGYEAYYEKNRYRMEEIREKMRVHLEAQRGRDRERELSEAKEQMLATIRKAKEEGKIILLLNGKVIIDLGVKYTKGVVHSDMSEWITHAVTFTKAHEDKLLLLIKPHPHENRTDLTLTTEKIDNLASLIRTELSDSTIYLDNDMFTNSELVPYMDVGLVWNGTSSLEFAAQGKKVLVADVWGHYDYPIGFVYPKSLEEYESYMLDPSLIEEREDISDRAITFLEYMGSDDVRVINSYSQTTLMNFNQFESTIDGAAVDRFVEEGDKALCDRFEELI